MILSTLFSLALASTAVVAQYGDYGSGYGDGYGSGYGSSSGGDSGSAGYGYGDSAPASSSSVAAATPSATAASDNTSAASGLTGGKTCVGPMCISAIVNATTTIYELTASGSSAPGWMAIGFGSTMANTPMVIMWANNDGTITLSQRQAGGEVQPKVVASPPRIATVDMSRTSLTSPGATFAFAVTTDPNAGTTQSLIWAYSSMNPGSADAGAQLMQHDSSAATTLDVSQRLAADGSAPVATSATAPMLNYQTLMLVHGVLMSLGFMVFLPSGVLIARLFRTSGNGWFKAHWLIQFYISGPVIIVGFILAIAAVQGHQGMHFNDTHKLVGLVAVILYLVQCALGAFIHFVKNADRKVRPPQNYVHAVLGLSTLGLALYNVHKGYDTEWPMASGLAPLPNGLNVIFIIWVIALPLAYVAGLTMLRRQFRQEVEAGRSRKLEML